MAPQKMLTIPLPAGDFVVSPPHTAPALLLTTEQWIEMRDRTDAELEAM